MTGLDSTWTGLEEVEIAGHQSGQDRLYGGGAWSLEKDELGTSRPREKGMNTKVSEPKHLAGVKGLSLSWNSRCGQGSCGTMRKSESQQGPTSSEHLS